MGRRFLRPGWMLGHLLVVVAVLVCLRLGWWQWDRALATDGSLQNWGYTVLWPAFGASFVYMWWRFVQLERDRDLSDDREMDHGLAAILEDDRSTGLAADEGTVAADPVVAGSGGSSSDDLVEPEPGSDPSTEAVTGTEPEIFVGTVEDVDDEDDPELAAYNRALAALAEEDHRRAR